MQAQILGIPWYRPGDYDRLRAMFDDGDKLPRTHAQWLAAAEQLEQRSQALGVLVVRVDIDPDDFAAWCREQARGLDAAARIRYAAARARDIGGGNHGGGVH